jgi:NTP pyrophosphatase (non-canonical NTP hydrolase)
MDLRAFQQLMESTYGTNDRARGVPATVAWLAEEVGELAQAVRKGTRAEQEHEFADVLAWLASLANQVGVDLGTAVERYADGCPRCGSIPCSCP